MQNNVFATPKLEASDEILKKTPTKKAKLNHENLMKVFCRLKPFPVQYKDMNSVANEPDQLWQDGNTVNVVHN